MRTIVACIIGLIAYTAIVGPLRNLFDDRWPYISVFLASPGRTAAVVSVVTGLLLATKHYQESVVYRRAAIGFSLLLLSGLMNSLYAAWAVNNRTELDKLVFHVPSRMFFWKWYFFIDVPNIVAAVGFVFLVLALVVERSERTSA